MNDENGERKMMKRAMEQDFHVWLITPDMGLLGSRENLLFLKVLDK